LRTLIKEGREIGGRKLMETVRKSIGKMFREVCGQYPERESLVHLETGVRYNYDLLLWEVERAATGLVKLGINKGDRVAIWAENVPEWVVAFLSIAEIGAIAVPVDPGAESAEVRHILDQSECRSIILTRGMEANEHVDVLLQEKGNLPSLEHMVLIGEKSVPEMRLWSELTGMGTDLPPGVLEEMEKSVAPEEPVAIMYTSGTTGRSKGVVLDHLGLVNKSMCSTERQGVGHSDRLCLFFPLFHMFGNTCIALAGLLRGAALVMPSMTFDPPAILHALDRERCTAIYGSPSMLIALVEHPEFQKKKWKSVKKGIIGGAPCPVELMRRLVEDIGISDITVGYGITETCSWVTMSKPDDPVELRCSTIGTALECNEVKIVDTSTGEDLPPGSRGELCARGFIMKEYYRMPGATAAAVDREGWFHTGDLGEMDDMGYFRITGRLKEVIKRNGIEIYPGEIEEVICTLPEVSEVQVFGFPHPSKGQEIAAWIRLRDGAALGPEEIREYVGKKVGDQRAPRYYKIVTEFPMTRSGKIQKFKLAELAEKEYLKG